MHKYICNILKHSMQYCFFLNAQKSPVFQAVKLVVTLKQLALLLSPAARKRLRFWE